MRVTQEKLPRSQMSLLVEVEADRSKQAYEKLVRDYMRTARIPGFRPGKAPRQLVLQFFGKERVKAAALGELIEASIREAIAQESIAPLGEPELQESFDELLTRYQPGEPLSFKAAVDVQPEVVLDKYRGLSVQYSESPFDPESVDRTLADYQQRQANLVPVEGRPAQNGDTAVIDFVGTKEDGSEIPGGKAEDFELELVPNRMIAGFVEGIVGMEIGQQRTLALTFPEDYPQTELAGVAASFEVELKDLKSKALPEINDDFAADISEFGTLSELRDWLEKQARAKAESETHTNRDTAIINALVAQATVELPATLVNREIQFLAEQSFRNLQEQGIDPSRIFTEDNMPRLRESLRNDAEVRLKRTLALAQIARLEAIQVDEAALTERVASLQGQIEEGISESALLEYAREELLTEKILDWLAQHSTMEIVPPGSASELAQDEEPAASEASTAEAAEPEDTP